MKKVYMFASNMAMICFASMVVAQDAAQVQPRRDQARPAENATNQVGQETGQQAQRGQPGQAGRAMNRGQSGEAMMAQCLVFDNQAEIALAEFAMNKASHDDVKKFATMMKDGHQKAIEKIRKFAPQAAGQNNLNAGTNTPGTRENNARDNDARARENNNNRDNVQNNGTRDANSNRDKNPRDDNNNAGENNTNRDKNARDDNNETRDNTARDNTTRDVNARETNTAVATENRRDAQDRPFSDRPVNGQAAINRQGVDPQNNEIARGGATVNMIQLAREVSQQCVEDSRKKLSEKSDEEFDECYIGMQIAMHAGMASKLKVFQRHATGDFKAVVDESLATTQKHLSEAEKIMDRLDNDDEDDSSKPDARKATNKE